MKESREEEKFRAGVLLQEFLQSPPPQDQEILSRLISEHASPLIREIIHHKFHKSSSAQDFEDVQNEVLVALLARLRDLRESPDGAPIQSFRDYVAVVAYNRCHQYFRRKYPHRRSLENRVRYILRHDPRFAEWQDGTDWICGNAESKSLRVASLEQVLSASKESGDNPELGMRLTQFFGLLGSPARLEDLVDAFSGMSADIEPESAAVSEPRTTDAEPAVFHRLYLEKAWAEICELSLKQRIALLLSLRDDNGEGMLMVFAAAGVAGIRKLAAALQMQASDLAGFWQDLPWDDLRIAEFLGVTRQQVINLRKCARERLGRRLNYFKGG